MKLDQVFELGYVINLDERTDRLQECEKEWYKINYYPERFSAIKNQHGPTGCYLSHLKLLQKARDENKNIIIFEDDVYFEDDCRDVIEKSLDELYNTEWDMMYWGGNILRPFYQVSPHLARLSHCQSTHCYSVSKRFLPQLVEIVEKNPMILDCLYADIVVPNFKAYIVVPMLASQRSSYSDIENKIMTYDVPTQRYWHFLVRNEKL
jgi:GR25 family glycosyltransferase involved in LPS biosynthesis